MAGLNLRVGINVLQATRELRNLGRALNGVGGAATKANVQARAAATGFTALGGAAAGAASAMLSLVGALSVFGAGTASLAALKFSADFEKSLADISTILGDSGVSIDEYRKKLLDLSTQSSKTLEDLSAGLYQTISAGIPAVEGAGGAFDVLANAQKAAVAGLASTEDAVDGTVSVLNAYGTDALFASDVTDKLLTTVKLGRVRFDDLAKGIGRVTTIAAQANVPLDDVLAVLIQLTRQGIRPAEAITGLRNILKSLIKPTEQTTRFISDFNKEIVKTGGAQIEFGEAALGQKGLIGVLRDLTKSTGGSSTALSKLFPNIRALVPALVAVGDGFDDVVGFQNQLIDSTGATEEAFAKVDKVFSETFSKLLSNLGRVAVLVTEGHLEDLNKQLLGLNKTLANQSNIEKFQKGLQVAIDKALISFDVLAVAVDGVVVGLGLKLFNFLGGLFTGFAGSVAAIAGSVVAAGAVAFLAFENLMDSIITIGANVDNIIQFTEGSFQAAEGGLQTTLAVLTNVVAILADLLFRIGSFVALFVQSLLTGIAGITNIVGRLIMDLLRLFGDFPKWEDTSVGKWFINAEAQAARLTRIFADLTFGRGFFGLANDTSEAQQELQALQAEAAATEEALLDVAKARGFASREEEADFQSGADKGLRIDLGAAVATNILSRQGDRSGLGINEGLPPFADTADKPAKVRGFEIGEKRTDDLDRPLPEEDFVYSTGFGVPDQTFEDFENLNAVLFDMQEPIEEFASTLDTKGNKAVNALMRPLQRYFLNFQAGNKNATLTSLELYKRVQARLMALGTVTKLQAKEVALIATRSVLQAEIVQTESELRQQRDIGLKQLSEEEELASANRVVELEGRLKNLKAQKELVEQQKTETDSARENANVIAGNVANRKLARDKAREAAAAKKRENQLLKLQLEAEKQGRKILAKKLSLAVDNERVLLRSLEIEQRLIDITTQGNQKIIEQNRLINFERDAGTGKVIATINKESAEAARAIKGNFEIQKAALEDRKNALENILNAELRLERQKIKNSEADQKAAIKKRIAKLEKLQIDMGGDSRVPDTIEEFQDLAESLESNIATAAKIADDKLIASLQESMADFKEKNIELLDNQRAFTNEYARAFFQAQQQSVKDFERAEETKNRLFLRSIKDREQRERFDQVINFRAEIRDSDAKKEIRKFRESIEDRADGLGLNIGMVIDPEAARNLSAILKSAEFSFSDAFDGGGAALKSLNAELGKIQSGELEKLSKTSLEDFVENLEIISETLGQGEDLSQNLFNLKALLDDVLRSTTSGLAENVGETLAQIRENFIEDELNVKERKESLKALADVANKTTQEFVRSVRKSLASLEFDIASLLVGGFEKALPAIERVLDSLIKRVEVRAEDFRLSVSRYFSDPTINIFGEASGAIKANLAAALGSLTADEASFRLKIKKLSEGRDRLIEGYQKDDGLDPQESERMADVAYGSKIAEAQANLNKVRGQIEEVREALEPGFFQSIADGVANFFTVGYYNIDRQIAVAKQALQGLSDVTKQSVNQARAAANLSSSLLTAELNKLDALRVRQIKVVREFEKADSGSEKATTLEAEAALLATSIEVSKAKRDRLQVETAISQTVLQRESGRLQRKGEVEEELSGLQATRERGDTSGSFLAPFKDFGGSIDEFGTSLQTSFKENFNKVEDFVPDDLFSSALGPLGPAFESYGGLIDSALGGAARTVDNVISVFKDNDEGGKGVLEAAKSIGEDIGASIEAGADFLADSILSAFDLSLDILKNGLMFAFEGFVSLLSTTLSPIGDAITAPVSRLLGSLGSAVSVLGDIPDEEDEERFRKESIEFQRAQLENIRARRDEGASNEELARLQSEMDEQEQKEEETAIERLTKEIDRAMQVAVNIAEQLGPLVEAFFTKVTEKLPEIFPKIVQGLTQALAAFAQGFPALIITLTRELVKALPDIIDAIIDMIPALITGFIGALTEIVRALPEIVLRLIDSIVENIPVIIDALIETLPVLIEELAKALPEIVGALVAAVPRIVAALLLGVPRLVGALIAAVPRMVGAFGRGLGRYFRRIFGGFASAVRAFINAVNAFARAASSRGGSSLIGGLLGGLVAFALAPATGGTSLLAYTALGAGLGAAAGYGASMLGDDDDEYHDGGNIQRGSVNKPLLNLFRSAGVQGFYNGGMVGDTLRKRFRASMNDDVPAILQTGEAVLNRAAVSNLGGPSAIDAINSGQRADSPVNVNVGINPSSQGLSSVAAALLPMLMNSITLDVTGGSGSRRSEAAIGSNPIGYRAVPGVR